MFLPLIHLQLYVDNLMNSLTHLKISLFNSIVHGYVELNKGALSKRTIALIYIITSVEESNNKIDTRIN
jgi:hypothetical protein